ncbi:hypothetical protein PoB_002528900 [Plakobranchus ocellatus]|uniref:Uncharacterized protein n=1 Tax=Plakobranchus ocellatus TaxID=259542 RepID=A0AAV3ZXY3_9GAST|nr:hypothetical protein PoB_002528900 [Plakobranchus ocellatus]
MILVCEQRRKQKREVTKQADEFTAHAEMDAWLKLLVISGFQIFGQQCAVGGSRTRNTRIPAVLGAGSSSTKPSKPQFGKDEKYDCTIVQKLVGLLNSSWLMDASCALASNPPRAEWGSSVQASGSIHQNPGFKWASKSEIIFCLRAKSTQAKP